MSITESSNIYPRDDYPMMHTDTDSVQVGDLENLIHILQDKINCHDRTIKSIKYPNLLLSSLIELNYLVGMARLKDSIALQVMRLIDATNNGEKSGRMLNTILYGPPGVGKTKVGIILAKIWYSLGYLKKPKTRRPIINTNKVNPTTINMPGNNNFGPLVTIVLLALFYGFAYIMSGVSYVYNKVGMMWLGFIVLFTVLVLLFLYWNETTYTYIATIVNNEEEEIKLDENKINQLNDRDLITVVSRQDFVAEYVGQTATKTKALLYANLGKVLFIDEAYSLINGERDPFGMEALTTLNLFMSEHPDGIAIILAGYKDLMKNGIFRTQPGLPRRCMWHFECDGYDGEQLSDIFFRQVQKDGWSVRKCDYNNIKNLICENEEIFSSYGGDTERLVFFSQLEASRNNIMRSSQSFSCSSRSGGSSRSSGSVGSSRSSGSSGSVGSSGSSRSDRTSGSCSSDRTSGSSGSCSSDRTSRSRSSRKSSNSDSYDDRCCRKIITYEHVQHGLRRLEENDINT